MSYFVREPEIDEFGFPYCNRFEVIQEVAKERFRTFTYFAIRYLEDVSIWRTGQDYPVDPFIILPVKAISESINTSERTARRILVELQQTKWILPTGRKKKNHPVYLSTLSLEYNALKFRHFTPGVNLDKLPHIFRTVYNPDLSLNNPDPNLKE